MNELAYYNENDPHAAAWLRELIKAGLIAPGDVDERSIVDVQPADLVRYRQCHFFAGIGGWSYALRLAGIADDEQIWTGSCPCQPFSRVNEVWQRGTGIGDERDLWPNWYHLIEKRRPSIVFGEEVDGAVTAGWLDRAFRDMECINYACGAAILPAISVRAPHARERLWFVCHTSEVGRKGIGIVGANNGANDTKQTWRALARTGNSYRGKKWFTQPGICPLVDGLPGSVDARVGLFGNAIVPQLAAEFIRASIEAIEGVH